jgi:primosomal protein N'
MRPISAEPNAKKGYIITHKCEKCGAVRRCRAAADDDISLIIALTVHD